MPTTGPGLQAFRFDDPCQERIHRRLQLIGPAPAACYRDACRLMAASPALETQGHLVVHLLRTLERALHEAFEPMSEHRQRLMTPAESGERPRTDDILGILHGLDIPVTAPVAQEWLRLALAHPGPEDGACHECWHQMQAILDAILERFETRYADTLHLLDELLAKASPSEDDAASLQEFVTDRCITHGYFFNRLVSPAWLVLLREKGFFAHPLGPELTYLARMATSEAISVRETVAEIIVQVAGTAPVGVVGTLADVALALPPRMAARWVQQHIRWIEQQQRLPHSLPAKLGNLITHLSRGGEADMALALMQVLLALFPSSLTPVVADEQPIYRAFPEPRARFDLWSYAQVLRDHVPDLVSVARADTLLLVCDLLQAAIRLSRPQEEPEGPEDHSYLWRPAVEEHPQNRRLGLRELLVSAVRDAAEHIATGNPAHVPALVQQFESRSWRIFHRLSLHLLRRVPQEAMDLIAARLTDRTHFDLPDLRHEYALLAGEHFPHLSPKEQATILDWIAAGPSCQASAGASTPNAREARLGKIWRLNRL
ncbi:MAG: hypothetical protein ACREOH_17095, partial [Candidatus Entotheonellia bacterium]